MAGEHSVLSPSKGVDTHHGECELCEDEGYDQAAAREAWRREAALRAYCAALQSPHLDRMAQTGLATVVVEGVNALLHELDKTNGR